MTSRLTRFEVRHGAIDRGRPLPVLDPRCRILRRIFQKSARALSARRRDVQEHPTTPQGSSPPGAPKKELTDDGRTPRRAKSIPPRSTNLRTNYRSPP